MTGNSAVLTSTLLRKGRVAALRVLGLLQNPGDVRYVPGWIASLYRRQTLLEAHMPWLPHSLLAHLEPRLRAGAVGFEFGSGGSTLWLAERVGSLTTVEHDPQWHAIIEQELKDSGVGNCTFLLCEATPGVVGADIPGADGVDYGSKEWEGSFESYVKVIDEWPDASFDLVLVDGRSRAACLLHAAPKVRPGGYLILDDTDREHYHEAMRALEAWPRKDFRGARPRFRELSPATCWTRPA